MLQYATSDLWIVKGRDFVIGRLYRKLGDSYVMAARSFELESMPETSAKVRFVTAAFSRCEHFSLE